MIESKTIIILGGGIGGLVTARELRKKLPKPHRIIIVEKNTKHVFSPSLLWLMTNKRTSNKITKSITKLERKGIEVIQGEITSIIPDNCEIEVNGENLKADFLVIALGSELSPERIPGLSEGGHNFYTLEGASEFREAWTQFNEGKLVVLTCNPVYKCPAAPYEAAMLLSADIKQRKLTESIQIDLYTAEPGPMGVTGEQNSKAVAEMVVQTGVNYHPSFQIENVDANGKKLLFSDATEVKYDVLAYVPHHITPKVVRESNLIDESGWIPVDPNNLQTSYENVYAIGDVTVIPLKMGKPLPKAGVFAHYQAEVVANNIAVGIMGKGKIKQYKGYGECFIEVGGGKAGFGKGNFYADPLPLIRIYRPRRFWHWGKVLFEKRWLRKWF